MWEITSQNKSPYDITKRCQKYRDTAKNRSIYNTSWRILSLSSSGVVQTFFFSQKISDGHPLRNWRYVLFPLGVYGYLMLVHRYSIKTARKIIQPPFYYSTHTTGLFEILYIILDTESKIFAGGRIRSEPENPDSTVGVKAPWHI